MVRFCDREVGCVEYNTLNRGDLLSYFLSGHLDEIVMVYDSFDTMSYIGNITYHSLLFNISINSAIRKEYLILDEDIWRNAREYFDRNDKIYGTVPIIPVVNEAYRVICFAYEDDDANREIHMLRELCGRSFLLVMCVMYLILLV